MKGYLLAGCAAVALAGTCGSAAADTAPGKFDIKLGGDAYFTAGVVNQQGDKNTRDPNFTTRFRLNVTPTARADNGIEYGAALRLRAYEGATPAIPTAVSPNKSALIDVDQSYIFFDGNFGRFELGLNQSPGNQYQVTAPNSFGTGGVTGDWTEGVNGWLTNQATFLEPNFGGGFYTITGTNWANKVSYFTPRFFGDTPQDDANPTGLLGTFEFVPSNLSTLTGISRSSVNTGIPSGTQSECAATGGTGTPLQGCRWDNVYELGLRYDGNLGPVSVSGSLGYERGSARTTISALPRTGYNDLSAYQAGLQLGYAGFLVGGSYLNAGKSGYAKTSGLFLSDQTAITAGISYQLDPFVIGFNYAHGEDAGDVTVPGTRSADLYSVGATYTVAPGLTTSLEYLHSTTKNEAGYGSDPFGNAAGVGSGNADLFLWKTAVSF